MQRRKMREIYSEKVEALLKASDKLLVYVYVSKKRNIYLHEGYTWKVKNGTHDGYSNHERSIICIWL